MNFLPVDLTDRIQWPSRVVPTNSAGLEPKYNGGTFRARLTSDCRDDAGLRD